MSSSDAIVVWIFDRLALDVAIVGDLGEERAQGRSTIWYWRQVLIASCIGIWRPIFQHKVLALRALATGCALNAVWLFLWSKFLHIGLSVRPEISFESTASLAIILLTQMATGWVVARTHRPYAIPMVLVFVIWLVLWYLGSSSEVKTLLVDSFGKPEFLPYLVWYLAPESVTVVGLLLGSFAGASSTKGTPSVPKVD
jgi:hypothetical protein